MPTFAGELDNLAVGVATLDDTGLRGGHRVVAGIAERDAINGSDFDKTGALVFVQSTSILYQRSATGWDVFRGASEYYGAAVTRYVDPVGGSDSNDGKTSGTAWQTTTPLASEAPHDGTAFLVVEFAPGTNASMNLGFPYAGFIVCAADRSVVDESFDTTGATLIAGKTCQSTKNVGAFGTVITDSSHWGGPQGQGVFGAPLRPMASTSPDFNFEESSALPYTHELYPYTCIVTSTVATGKNAVLFNGFSFEQTSFNSFWNSNFQESGQLYCYGCRFMAGPGVNGFFLSSAPKTTTIFSGCYFGRSGVPTVTTTQFVLASEQTTFDRCFFDVGTRFNYEGINIAGQWSDLIMRSADTSLPAFLAGFAGTSTFYPTRLLRYVSVKFSAVDWECAGDCIWAGAGAAVHIGADWSCDNVQRLFQLRNNAQILTSWDPVTITGTVTAASVLETGACAQSGNLGAAVNWSTAAATLANTSSAGDDIIIGGNPVTSWASLPETDYALGNASQGCRGQ